MSLKLFAVVLEYAFEMLNWDNRGIDIDGKRLEQLSFANVWQMTSF